MTHNPNDADSVFARVRVAFRRVYGVPLPERPAALAEQCGGDSELTSQVESLLRAFDDAGEFLPEADLPSHLPPATAANHSPFARRSAQAGEVLSGKYALARRIGAGGMGEVWEADQVGAIRRRVAVKLIRPGLRSWSVLERFEAERQVLAVMDHPHIARVLDAGTTDAGHPYLVMELIAGDPITRYCDARRLDLRERLTLFIRVCEAVQHAHQKGVIHRDLKPGNVLVETRDGAAAPKVIDFGLAKLLAPVGRFGREPDTRPGTVLGTPQYMAPEQVGGNPADVDTRADVYALGAILYELLTGRPPLAAEWEKATGLEGVVRLVREADTPPPSTGLTAGVVEASRDRRTDPRTLASTLRGDLDWITMKALAKERGRRYETASALAQDVAQHLRGEPVAAAPPSAGYRLRKFARRHRIEVVAGGVVAATLVFATVCATWGYVVANRARVAEGERAAGERAAKEQALRGEADANRALDVAFDSLDAATSTVIEDTLASQTAISPEQKRFLIEILPTYRQLVRQAGEGHRLRIARSAGRVGQIEHRLGHTDESLTAYQLAVQEFQALADSPPGVRRELAHTHTGLADLLFDLGRYADAERAYRRARTIQSELNNERVDGIDCRRELSATHLHYGQLLRTLGRATEAEREYRAALALQQQLVGETPSPGHRRRYAATNTNLGHLLTETGLWEEADSALRLALGIQRELSHESPSAAVYRNDLAWTHNNLGLLHWRSGLFDRATEELQRAVTLREKLVHDFPAVPDYRRELGAGLSNLGLVATDARKLADAEAALRKAITIHTRLVTDFPERLDHRRQLAVVHDNLGNVLLTAGSFAAAEPEYGHALAIRERLAADRPTNPDCRHELARSYVNLGVLRKRQGKWATARELYEKALAVRENLAADFPAITEYQIDLGVLCLNLGNLECDTGSPGGVAWYDKCVATVGPVLGREPRAVPARGCLQVCYSRRAGALDLLGQHAEAVADWGRSIDLSADDQKPGLRVMRAYSRVRAGQTDEGVRELEAATQKLGASRVAWYNSACAYAVAGGLADGKQGEYATRAIECLRKAIAHGWKDAGHMAKDDDLKSLRERDDFRQLVATLRTPTPPSRERLPLPRAEE